MRYNITMALILLGINAYSQSWQFLSRSSDFDGSVKSTRSFGNGGTSPYTSPTLAVNYFESSNSVNFYLKGAGYTGCDGNRVTMVFDGERKYFTYRVDVNENKDAIFFDVFTKADEGTILPMELIFDQMMNSKRLSLRFESDCFKRDYYFNLDGFKESIIKVLSQLDIERSISFKLNMKSFNDSLVSLINTPGIGFIDEFDNSEIDKYPLFFNPQGKPYKLSSTDLRQLIRILNSFRLGYEHQEEYMLTPFSTYQDEFRVVFRLSDINEIYAVSARDYSPDTSNTGYFVEISGDSLKLKLTPSQRRIETVIKAYKGRYNYPVNRLLRRLINDDFHQNTLSESTLDDLARKMKDNSVYQLRIVKGRNGMAEFEEKSSKDMSWFSVYGITFPYKFKKSPEELELEKIQKARELFIQDSTRRWRDTPDPTKPPLQFHQVTKHPKPKDCPEFGLRNSHTCIENYITAYLISRLPNDDLKKFKDFEVTVIIDGYGNIRLHEIQGLNKKRSEEVANAFRGIFPIEPARNGWGSQLKVVDVIASFDIRLR